MSEFSMKPSNVFARIVKWLERHDREIARLASAPIRNASIDGPVTISHRGAVTSTADDGSATRIAGGMAEVQSAPDEPWVPITAQSEADAQAALDAAAQAVLDAAAAQDSADEKSTIVRSVLDAPTGPQPDYRSGDEWRKVSGGFVTAVWQHDGTEFVSQVLTGTMLSADAIDGKTVTGSTVQTVVDAARGVKIFSSGLVGYDADGNAKTIIDATTGKITAVDGTFTGTVFGSSIVGGSVSIAQGNAATITENFEAASGTTPPSGWTRRAIASSGSGGITFLTSGGNPSRCAQLRMVPVVSGAPVKHYLHPTSAMATDANVALDYSWDGTENTNAFDPTRAAVLFRMTDADITSGLGSGLQLELANGRPRLLYGSSPSVDLLPYASPGVRGQLPRNTWSRIEASMRGGTLRARITVGGVTYPWVSSTTTLAPIAGRVALFTYSGGILDSSGGVNQTTLVDNVTIEVLQTGLQVAEDGATTVERLSINQVGMAPDPMGPTDIVNLRSMLAVLPVTRVVASGAVGNTNASGYVTVPVSPALTGTPRAVNVLPNNSQLIGSCDLLNSSATSLRIYFRTITSAGAPVLASANPGQFSWTAFP